MDEQQSPVVGWTRVYHRSGLQITVPISLAIPLTQEAVHTLAASAQTLVDANFTASPPAGEPGEQIEEIAHVTHRLKQNRDGGTTPVLDLYTQRSRYRVLQVYLNSDAEVQDFQETSGVKLETLPIYDGDSPIERQKNPRVERFVTALPRPLRVIWRDNPAYVPGDKVHARRLFVRWMNPA